MWWDKLQVTFDQEGFGKIERAKKPGSQRVMQSSPPRAAGGDPQGQGLAVLSALGAGHSRWTARDH